MKISRRRSRETVPGVALTTDLIVGFSGESEDQFQRSLDVLEAVKFDKVHSAAYSVRPGTIASRQHPDDVTAVEKKRRLKAVEALQDRVQTEINAVYQGREYEILVDGHTRGRVTGRTRTDKLVFLEGAESESGRFVNVKIEGTTPYSLTGRVVESELAEAVTV
ncbi:MAG: TRAM domain-containing protein [Chloroflexi bacterium]|nr:TRAM domain-containing protein [Chloroflexota bacterium]